jgi:hypothetical protein
MTKITAYTALTSAVTSDVVPVVDVSDTTMAASGTTKKITLANLVTPMLDATATDIAQSGAQAAGAVGLAADAGHVHPAASFATPADHGFLAWYFPPMFTGSGGNLITAGNVYLIKFPVRRAFTATTAWMYNQTGGSGASTGSFMGLINNSGTLLTSSADCGSTFTSGGLKSVNFTTPQALTTATPFVWLAFVFNLATTQPSPRQLSGGTLIGSNINLTAATGAVATAATGQTSLSSITPSANNISTGAAAPYWCAIS